MIELTGSAIKKFLATGVGRDSIIVSIPLVPPKGPQVMLQAVLGRLCL